MKPEGLQGKDQKRLLLVDGHAYAYRAFFAIRKLVSPDGKPVNSIYGFIKMLDALIAAVDPACLCVVWDGGLDEGRTTLHPDYKAGRPAMPEDLRIQLDQICAYLRAKGIRSICQEGVEADDLIASIATTGLAEGFFVVIASADKDFMQLVSDRLILYNASDKRDPWLGPVEVIAKTGVRSGQISEWLSLIGDAVDNIEGVPGVGPKTASELLGNYGSVQGIYDNLASVGSNRIRTALEASRASVDRNLKLIRLETDLANDFSEAGFSRGKSDLHALRSLYERWGFRKMLAETDRQPAGTMEFAF